MLADHHCGLGLRREMMASVVASPHSGVDFWEIAPENWLGLGGRYSRQLAAVAERDPLICHGLSLSIGGPEPLDLDHLRAIVSFMHRHGVELYSEHLSYCAAGGHLYDLLPIPFTPAAIDHVVSRIQQVQEVLGAPLVLENSSYYLAPAQQMSELEFICAVVASSGCQLLLDVNNVYVNASNHGYDPKTFIRGLPSGAIRYMHVAGHYREADGFIIDTHGAPVIDPVWQLLQYTYGCHGLRPTLLERDFNIPAMPELLAELAQVRHCQRAAQQQEPA